MKELFKRVSPLFVAFGVALIFDATLQAATSTKAPAPAETNSVTNGLQQEIPKSLFVIPSSPKEGRNPFFPQSAEVVPVPEKARSAPVDSSMFVLNGMTPSGPKRTAMINSRTFEAGESGEVKLPSGNKALIKCEEIRNDSVIIVIDGQRRELRLRFGL
jgi:hypothetical protein